MPFGELPLGAAAAVAGESAPDATYDAASSCSSRRQSLLLSAPPDERMVDLAANSQLRRETEELQLELNARSAERKAKQERFDRLQQALRVVAFEKVPPEAAEKTKFLQHQLWAIEQAWGAERKYHGTLRQIVRKNTDGERLCRQESNVLQRALDKANRDLVRARDKGLKIAAIKTKADAELRRFRRAVEDGERERAVKVAEYARAHRTSDEIAAQRERRQLRALDISLEVQGDLDEEGEEELRHRAADTARKAMETQRGVQAAMERESYLKITIDRLREVTNADDADGMLSGYFAQKDQHVELFAKKEAKSATKAELSEELVYLTVNKLELAGIVNSEHGEQPVANSNATAQVAD
jgi:hypothetical protein